MVTAFLIERLCEITVSYHTTPVYWTGPLKSSSLCDTTPVPLTATDNRLVVTCYAIELLQSQSNWPGWHKTGPRGPPEIIRHDGCDSVGVTGPRCSSSIPLLALHDIIGPTVALTTRPLIGAQDNSDNILTIMDNIGQCLIILDTQHHGERTNLNYYERQYLAILDDMVPHGKSWENQSINQSNFYSANIPGEARLSGSTADVMVTLWSHTRYLERVWHRNPTALNRSRLTRHTHERSTGIHMGDHRCLGRAFNRILHRCIKCNFLNNSSNKHIQLFLLTEKISIILSSFPPDSWSHLVNPPDTNKITLTCVESLTPGRSCRT